MLSDILSDILYCKSDLLNVNTFTVISRALWFIKNFPSQTIPFTRIGLIVVENERQLEEYVIRIEEDFIWLGIEGIERTEYGSDSYEVCKYHYSIEEVNIKTGLNADAKFDDITEWYLMFKECIIDTSTTVLIETVH